MTSVVDPTHCSVWIDLSHQWRICSSDALVAESSRSSVAVLFKNELLHGACAVDRPGHCTYGALSAYLLEAFGLALREARTVKSPGNGVERNSMALHRRIDFDSLTWQSPMGGLRFKAYEHEGKRLRLVEYTMQMEPHWCEKGHIGLLLEGRLQIRFAHEGQVYQAGDGIWIRPALTTNIWQPPSRTSCVWCL